MSKTSAAVKNRYAAKTYDRIALIIPKGRKAAVEAFAREHGESVNGMVNRLVRAEMGLTEDDWKNVPIELTAAAMEEAERISHDPTVKGFSSLDELFAELKS